MNPTDWVAVICATPLGYLPCAIFVMLSLKKAYKLLVVYLE